MKKIKIEFITMCMILLMILSLFSGCKKNGIDTDEPSVASTDIEEKEWALNNYAQTINGVEGVAGIDINIINAWNITKGSNDVVIGIVDTGIDYNSGNILNNIWENSSEIENDDVDNDNNGFTDDILGWDFYNMDNSIYDSYLYDYHGTYLANTIMEVAPEVTLISSKFLQGTSGDASDSVKAITYAIDNGATIINCSWCFEDENEDLYNLIKDNDDIIFVCAAGNYRTNLEETSIYPASYDLENIISVMAINNTGEMYDASGYGSVVDVAAPGEDIWITLPENDQEYVSGTSIATAFVTGTIALMKSVNSDLTPQEIKEILLLTSNPLDSLEGLCQSEGCINAYEAVQESNQ